MKNHALKTKPIQSRLDIEHISKLKELAEQKGISFSLLIRLIIIDYVEVNYGK
jgi:predicted DNA binding CopG/RHH family protein